MNVQHWQLIQLRAQLYEVLYAFFLKHGSPALAHPGAEWASTLAAELSAEWLQVNEPREVK
jgi:hypothetical protein